MFRSLADGVYSLFAHLTNQASNEVTITPGECDIVLATTLANENITLATTLQADDLYLTSAFSCTVEEPERPFQFRIDTTQSSSRSGSTSTNYFFLFLSGTNENSLYTYDMTVDWGDGTTDTYSGTPIFGEGMEHDYGAEGEYVISIYGVYPRIQLGVQGGGSSTASDTDDRKIMDVLQWGTSYWQSWRYMFNVCRNLTDMSCVDVPRFEDGTEDNNRDLSRAFRGALGLTTINNLEYWAFPAYSNVSYFFLFSFVLNDANVGKIDVSQVVCAENFLYDARLFNQPIDQMNWASIPDASNGCFDSFLDSADSFNQPLPSWPWYRFDDLHDFFLNALSFNQDISEWGLGQIENQQLYGFLTGTSFSTENYDKALEFWATDSNTATGVNFEAADTQYSSDQQANRDYLTDTLGWTINDAGAAS